MLLLAAMALWAATSSVRAQAPSPAQRDVVIHEIHCNPDEETELVEFVELFNRGGEAVDLSGWRFDAGLTYAFPAGTTLPANGYIVVAESPYHLHAKWSSGRVPLDPALVLGPYEGRLDNDGERIALRDAAGALVDEVQYRIGFPWPTVGDPVPEGTSGTGHSLQLVNPSFDNGLPVSWSSGAPTPLRANRAVATSNMRPFVREIKVAPRQPTSREPVTVTARVTDANGIAGVVLEYQVVRPGHYIPLRLPAHPAALAQNPDAGPTDNPDFFSLANWTHVSMRDDGAEGDAVAGDDVHTAVIPAQGHRTLVRYRLQAMDLRGTITPAPYADDPSMNFAYFVYDDVPDYAGFSSEMLQTLPIYHLLTRQEDMRQALGYDPADQMPQYAAGGANPARFVYNWFGTFVYDGIVYDNIRYRLRGANGRYLGGNTKRSMRFRFHRGQYFQAKDAQGKPYPTPWRTLVTAKGFDNRLTLTYGFNEHVNYFLFNKMRVPAPYSHFFHFRVIDDEREAPDPWRGDFWGLSLAQEPYDVRFLEAHGLEKGNLYKLINATTNAKEQQNYQAPYAVADGSDHDNIQYNLTSRSTPDFVRAHVRLDKWYAYHSLAQAIRHYDYWPTANKNAAWYFEPVYTPENRYLGTMWTLPWDTDATWGPTWNDGIDVVYNSVFPRNSELQPDYFGAIREVRDLLWQRDQIGLLLGEFATPLVEFVKADLVRWLDAPSDAGNYRGLSGAGKRGLPALVEDMLAFAFEGGSWPGGSVGTGGRAAFLDTLADNADGSRVPNKPAISYIGEPDYPINGLRFRTSAFSDPQGAGTFGAMKWRIAQVSPQARTTTSAPSDDNRATSFADLIAGNGAYEIEPLWESPASTRFAETTLIPAGTLEIGKTYRVRCRMQDNSGYWSRWSDPVQFKAGEPLAIGPIAGLRITELMYHPAQTWDDADFDSEEFEFIELKNISDEPLDLSGVSFTEGVTFAFQDSAITSLDPGQFVLVVQNKEAFAHRYGQETASRIAGQYEGKLANEGESIRLVDFWTGTIAAFAYSDKSPWPKEADGQGYSLVPLETALSTQPTGSLNNAASWRPSTKIGGTPARDDS